LVTYEEAASGLPFIVGSTNGDDGILNDGGNGILIGTQRQEIAVVLRTVLALNEEQRRRMAERAEQTVCFHSIESFVNSWHEVYGSYAFLG
jgi:glycosyltransferase involved in cell wall biosynthesis